MHSGLAHTMHLVGVDSGEVPPCISSGIFVLHSIREAFFVPVPLLALGLN